jgi:hypothetical protein
MEKRKTLLISPDFQLKYLAYSVSFALLGVLILYGANLYFFWDLKNTGKSIGLPPNHVFFQFVQDRKMVMNFVFGITGTVVFLLLGISGLFLSHKVAGPMVRFKAHLKKLTKTKTIDEVKFREKDFFQDIAEAFNEFVRSQKKN